MSRAANPSAEQVKMHVLSTMRHVFNIYYHVNAFWQIYGLLIVHPKSGSLHDVTGPGSKYHLPVIEGMALAYLSEPGTHQRQIDAAVELHRQQPHHQTWNLFSALDALCARREDRPYKGNGLSSTDLVEVIRANDPKHATLLWRVYRMMKDIPPPNLQLISLEPNIPNIGVPNYIHREIITSTREALRMLTKYGYEVA